MSAKNLTFWCAVPLVTLVFNLLPDAFAFELIHVMAWSGIRRPSSMHPQQLQVWEHSMNWYCESRRIVCSICKIRPGHCLVWLWLYLWETVPGFLLISAPWVWSLCTWRWATLKNRETFTAQSKWELSWNKNRTLFVALEWLSATGPNVKYFLVIHFLFI